MTGLVPVFFLEQTMKHGKQESFSQSKGSAPHQDKHASRETGGNSGKHGMNRKAGKSGNKVTASAKPGCC